MTLVFKRIDSPVGLLKLVANEASLAAILWENDSPRRVRLGPLAEILATPHLSAERQLAEYFEGSASSSMSRSPRRHAVPDQGLAGPPDHPLRRDPQL